MPIRGFFAAGPQKHARYKPSWRLAFGNSCRFRACGRPPRNSHLTSRNWSRTFRHFWPVGPRCAVRKRDGGLEVPPQTPSGEIARAPA